MAMQQTEYAARGKETFHQDPGVRGLGWFSIGLGLSQVLMPGRMSKFIGLKNHRGLMRVLGIREIASGLGIVSQNRPALPMWARVGGDVMDLALLSGALTKSKGNRRRMFAATAAVAGVTALDYYYSKRVTEKKAAAEPEPITKSITINRSSEDLYRVWRNFQNLPKFMKHIEKVEILGENRSRWTAKIPGGKRIQWESEILLDRPNEEIVWRSLEGSDVQNSGSVRFEPAPANRGTRVVVQMEISEFPGQIGSTIAKLVGKIPEQIVQEDLRSFKQLMETGEIATTEGQPSGRKGLIRSALTESRRNR
jgi:uncharacterized membrane protein